MDQIIHHAAGKKGEILAANLVWETVPVQKVNERKGTFVVPVQHGRLDLEVFCSLEQVAVLTLRTFDRENANLRARRTDGMHGLGMPAFVAGDQAASGFHDRGIGAKIILHQQNSGACMLPFKIQKSLRKGRAEAVDALILIPNQKQIIPSRTICQNLQNFMLYERGVLGFVHAHITVEALELRGECRTLLEDGLGIDHLVVVIHPAELLHAGRIAAADL